MHCLPAIFLTKCFLRMISLNLQYNSERWVPPSHFTDDKTEAPKLSNLPAVTQPAREASRMSTQAVVLPPCYSRPFLVCWNEMNRTKY